MLIDSILPSQAVERSTPCLSLKQYFSTQLRVPGLLACFISTKTTASGGKNIYQGLKHSVKPIKIVAIQMKVCVFLG